MPKLPAPGRTHTQTGLGAQLEAGGAGPLLGHCGRGGAPEVLLAPALAFLLATRAPALSLAQRKSHGLSCGEGTADGGWARLRQDEDPVCVGPRSRVAGPTGGAPAAGVTGQQGAG